jgi:uncharacterized membrane protein YfcA
MKENIAMSIILLKYSDEDDTRPENKFEILEKSHWQPRKLFGIFVILVCLLLTKLLQGNLDFKSLIGIRLCSVQYWLVLGVFCLICVFFILWNSSYALWEHIEKKKTLYKFTEGDMKWTKEKIILVTVIAFSGGLLSSIVGVGGGIIFSPLLVSLDMHPTVAVSTAIYIETYMVLTTNIQYILNNALYVWYGLFLGIFSLAGTIIGLYIIH